jgi:sec-independent protein translocase protein TatB
MFDLDAGKLLVFGIVALAVIPPKDLPRVLRTVGQYVGKMRRMASEFQGQFMDAMKEAEKAADLESVKKEFHSMDEAARIDSSSFHPTAAMRSELPNSIEPPKSIEPLNSSEPDKSTEPPHANGGSVVVAEASPIGPPAEPFSSNVVVKAPEVPEGPPPSAESHAPGAP